MERVQARGPAATVTRRLVLFVDRREAGRRLAPALERFREPQPVVIALPRGGVPVADNPVGLAVFAHDSGSSRHSPRNRRVAEALIDAGLASALATAVAAVAMTVLFASSAWASPAGPSPFRHDLHRIDARLRMGIEYAPVELGEELGTSETVCRLAEKVERGGDPEAAAADWSTLSQLVEELDRPAWGRVDGALQRADAELLDLRKRHAGGWPDRDKVATLERGVARTRAGIGRLRIAMGKIAESFDAWSAHQCQAATEAVETGIARIPSAVTRVSAGMRVLWALAIPRTSHPQPSSLRNFPGRDSRWLLNKESSSIFRNWRRRSKRFALVPT